MIFPAILAKNFAFLFLTAPPGCPTTFSKIPGLYPMQHCIIDRTHRLEVYPNYKAYMPNPDQNRQWLPFDHLINDESLAKLISPVVTASITRRADRAFF